MSPLAPTLLHPTFWPEVRRGSERAIRLLADGLVAEGHRPRLVCGHPGRAIVRGEEEGLEIVRLPRPARRRLLRQRYDVHAAHHPLAAPLLVADPGPLLHAFYPTEAVLAARVIGWRRRLRQGARLPLVVSVMGPPDRPWAVVERGRLEGLVDAARSAAVVTSLSEFAAERLWRTFAVRSEIVAPPVDLDAFMIDATVERDPVPTLLFSSDPASGAKRLPLLLEALALLRRELAELELVVSRPRDPALTRELEAVPGVRLRDLDERPALVDAYRRAWVTVLPSFNEAFGLVVAESLACGTPAVAFAGEGPAEVIRDDRVGRIAPEATPEQLAAAIRGALELRPEPGLRERCRAAVDHLGVPGHTARTLELYAAALDG
ncbi:glycosyltransferase family 4 protein [Patulibacter defluvii]|uniref:glycosyltransferase family 4 protein n=1 Tax=Patulibacter defluvii TaxID=3095358 RepID=UPI002A76474A|nr:glycosyltransferase family 4 protein [Patulibacter sp. DM4]